MSVENKIASTGRLAGLREEVLEAYSEEVSEGAELNARYLIWRYSLLDESALALDVSIQAQVVNLINEVLGKPSSLLLWSLMI
jgi:ABC-type oligopeptide transport system ATPase subunit